MGVLRLYTRVFAFAGTAFAASLTFAVAEAPDLTTSMQALGNPNKTRWSDLLSRHVASIGVHDGQLYVSGGHWENNTGPCPIFAVDPYSGAFASEFTAGTESVDYYRYGSDGSMYIPSIDPKDGHVNSCDVTRRSLDGTWSKGYASSRKLGDVHYDTHTWDFVVWHGWRLAAGYGLSVGEEGATGRMTDASPYLTSDYMAYSYKTGSGASATFQRYRRLTAFLPFADEVFAFPLDVCYFDDTGVTTYDIEEHRFDGTAGRFVCQTNTPANLYPGLCASDFALHKQTSVGVDVGVDVKMWHPTPFKGRVLYIPGSEKSPFVPIAALCSATNVDHHVVATRVVLGSGVYPFGIFPRGDVVSVVAAQYDPAASNVVNSVWESADGLSFVKKFTFTAAQQASAVAYLDGAYYFAMGARSQVSCAWTLGGSDIVGELYRIKDPDVKTSLSVVAESETLSVSEGGEGVARFRLSEQPDGDLRLPVIVKSRAPSVTATVAEITFTTGDWSAWHEVPFFVADDDEDAESASVISVGAGCSATVWPVSVRVEAANDEIRVVETAPVGIEDLTSPGGTFTAPASQWAMKPFNDDTTCGDSSQRVLLRTNAMTITYKFDEATLVNAYGMYNYTSAFPDERAPHTWTFEGSDDGESWVRLDERLYESDWTAGEYRYYSFANATAYLQYRICITENNGADFTQFSHLEFYDTSDALEIVDTTNSGGVVSASSSHASYGPSGAFDGNRENSAGRWLANRAAEMFVVYGFDEATVVNAILIWNGSDAKGGYDSAGRAPKDWTFSASNDGDSWTTLDTRTDETGWASAGESRIYRFGNSTAYKYYRFCCTALNDAVSKVSKGAEYLQIWEIEFLVKDVSAADVPQPVIGGEGASKPMLAINAKSGAEEFTFSIGNAVKGVKYQVYMTTSLSLPFEACGDVVEAEADGTLEFSVATGGAASAFFKVGCDSLRNR